MSLPAKKKRVPKRVYRNGRIFLPWDSFKVCQAGHFYTTIDFLFYCLKILHIEFMTVIACDEVIEEETKAFTTNINEKNVICNTKKIYIFLAFLLITVVLLIAVSIYYYLMKYKAKQKHLRHK